MPADGEEGAGFETAETTPPLADVRRAPLEASGCEVAGTVYAPMSGVVICAGAGGGCGDNAPAPAEADGLDRKYLYGNFSSWKSESRRMTWALSRMRREGARSP